jgi:hypothetical protein
MIKDFGYRRGGNRFENDFEGKRNREASRVTSLEYWVKSEATPNLQKE